MGQDTQHDTCPHFAEKNTNQQGKRMALCGFRTSEDIDIVWEEDDSVQHTTYHDFKSGAVIKSSTPSDNTEWVGLKFNDRNGFEAILTEFIDEDNVTVRYPDGDIISGLTLEDVVNGDFTRVHTDTATDQLLFGEKNRKAQGIQQERADTFDNVCYMLLKYRRCLMVRPCAFGKTWIGIQLFKLERYKKCLFLHPEKDDLNSSKVLGEDFDKSTTVHSKTFNWLWGLSDQQIKTLDYDIVFIDEAHKIVGDAEQGKGAIRTFDKVQKLMNWHPRTHFVGATATPIRMDGIDVSKVVFNNHECYPYSIEDAVRDGYIKPLNYRYFVYEIVKKLSSELGKPGGKKSYLNREGVLDAMNLSAGQIEEIDTRYMDRHIRETCDKLVKDTSYMRFIVYYRTNLEIEINREKIIGWFHSAYPEHEITDITVTGLSDHDLKDIDNLQTHTSDPVKYRGKIDLIFNCEMLCTGYHSELLTGMVMDRKTRSLAKYYQMLGRLLSCDNDHNAIVFDIADNIHADFIVNTEPVPITMPEQLPIQDKGHGGITYQGVLSANPYATDWNIVRECNNKAKKAEELAKEYVKQSRATAKDSTKTDISEASKNPVMGSESSENSINIQGHTLNPSNNVTQSPNTHPVAHNHLPSPATSEHKKTLKEVLGAVTEDIKEKGLPWQDAVTIWAGIEEEYGADNINRDITEENRPTEAGEKKDAKASPGQDDIRPKPQTDNAAKTDAAASKPEPSPKTAQEKDGFIPGTYRYNYKDQSLSKVTNLLCTPMEDYMERIRAAQKLMLKTEMDKVIEKWKALNPDICVPYESYEEVERKGPRFKLLQACAQAYGNGGTAEQIIRYMVEGVA